MRGSVAMIAMLLAAGTTPGPDDAGASAGGPAACAGHPTPFCADPAWPDLPADPDALPAAKRLAPRPQTAAPVPVVEPG